MNTTPVPNNIVPDSTTLRCTTTSDAIYIWIGNLISQRYLTHVDRAVLTGLWQLKCDEMVIAKRIRLALMNLHGYDSSAEVTLQVRQDHNKAWKMLSKIVGGLPPIKINPGTEEHDQRVQRWLQDVMNMLDLMHNSNQQLPVGANIPDMLPPCIVDDIKARAASSWFESPYAIGAAMYTVPIRSGFNTEQAVSLADALTHAAHGAVITLNLSMNNNNASKKVVALKRLSFLWAVLKGYAHSMVSSGAPNAPANILAHSDIVKRILDTLQDGGSAIAGAKEQIPGYTPLWENDQTPSAQMSVAELLELLRAEAAEHTAS